MAEENTNLEQESPVTPTVEQEVYKELFEKAQADVKRLEDELRNAQKENLKLAVTASTQERPKESFSDILRQQPFHPLYGKERR